MEESRKLDLLNSPLERTNLIEASAGTGKTYAITGIFLRLLLEKRFSVGEILVVTYTVAATEELRDRIRRTIRGAIHAFARGGHEDPFLDGLVKHYGDDNPLSVIPALSSVIPAPSTVIPAKAGIQEALRILRAALRDFDEAPIFTIHGFCQRALHENAFESMSLFDTELDPDERFLNEEIVRDFWRMHFYEVPKEFTSYSLNNNINPEYFQKLIRGKLLNTEMRILPEARPVSLDALPPFREAREKVRVTWRSVRDDIAEKLSDPGLNKTKYKNPEALMTMMDGYVDSESPLLPFNGFDKFTSSCLEKGTNKGKTTPEHPFFDDCEHLNKTASELESQIEGQLLFLKTDIFRYAREELRKRKERQNIQSFDDLLNNLREALDQEGGRELAGLIRKRYHAALIDEFQDTDPIQYAIFQHIFGVEGSPLFFIGDPKQSIYSFRGADLFAYMRASRHVDTRYTLTSNWRSEPDLVRAVNTIFETPGRKAFLYDEVPFESAVAGDVKDRRLLTFDGRTEPPLHLWFIHSDRLKDEGAKTNKSLTADLIVGALTAEISRLLELGREKKAMIGAEPLFEGHIAILVRTNREARLVQETLRDKAIHSVLHSTGNLFDTHESLEMARVLAGIAEPHSESKVRVALSTDMLGLKGEGLEGLSRSESEWEAWVTRFRDYNDLWEQYGFISMFRYFLSKETVRERLLTYPDGERRLTNILHLMEVLHTESVGQKLGMTGLIKWLSRQRDEHTLRLEEYELRLESDACAVRIVTIHKSKGLEYPIVFCPFNWGHSTDKTKEFTYHDPEDNWRLNLVLDPSAGYNKSLAEKESLAENIRLLYVSLTRAKNRCYLVWGPFKDAGTSSLAFVLHPPEDGATDIVEATETKFKNRSDTDMRFDLESIAARAGGAISVYDMPESFSEAPPPPAELSEKPSCRTFPGITDRDRRIASFSYFLSERIHLPSVTPEDASDLPDRDGGVTPTETPYSQEATGIFAFPKGAKAGNLLHDILEYVDFTNPDSDETKNIVVVKLKQHGFDSQWQEAVCEMIGRVVSSPLQPGLKSPALSTVGKEDRLNELEFYFPLNRLTPDTLKKTFTECGMSPYPNFPGKIGRLNFQPVRGFMKGFMDLVFRHDERFYLIDWKSNFLGPSLDDYKPEALVKTMEEEFYILQYHLYVLAVHRYLRMRLPGYGYDTHFGGVFYIFLRGLDPSNVTDTGIFRDRPAKETIDYLGDTLIAK
jgi:exodeoxyribonuclease V beta subunit